MRLSTHAITKRYGALLANDSVDFDVAPGEAHALLGENGAGKSTLVKILYGLLTPDSGEIRWHGKPKRLGSVAAAQRLGIAQVFQHFSLFDGLTVGENLRLGLPKPLCYGGPPLFDRLAVLEQRYGLTLELARPAHTLPVGIKQRIEIARALLRDPQLLIMDEPTSVLAPLEVDDLFKVLRGLVEDGISVIYITHKLDEVRALCSRATVLRQGRVVGTVDPRQVERADLAAMMLGTLPPAITRSGATAMKTRLALCGVSAAPTGPFGTPLDELSLDAHAGEVLGIAGVAGNGQDELIAVLSGEAAPSAGTIRLDDNAIETLGANARRARGLAVIPEQRNDRAAVLDFPLSDNRLMTGLRDPALVRNGWIRSASLMEATAGTIRAYDVKAEGPAALGCSLSGGNLQKFIVGRALQADPGVLVAASPTWGVDTGAATAIRRLLVERARDGSAVVVISQDLEELLAISDRLVVLTTGRLSPPLTPDRFNPTLLGLWMTVGVPWSEPDAT